MSELARESLRNVALISSAGAGKTSLAEAMLFAAGAVPHLGSIAQGTTVSDFEPEELHRRSSVSTSLLRCSWNHTTINLVDPPGALNLARGDGHGIAGGGCRDPGGRRLVGDPERTRQSLVPHYSTRLALSSVPQRIG